MKHENLPHNAAGNSLFSLHKKMHFKYPVNIAHECTQWVKKLQYSWGTAAVNLPLGFTNISRNVHPKPINKQAFVPQFWLFRDEKTGSFAYEADKLRHFTLNAAEGM